jgi:CheY-like chemotaxis protein
MKKKLNCILLIDDDEPTNFISEMLIEEADCAEHIQIAQTGQTALNYLTNSDRFESERKDFPSPNLIFLDINMPAMNGWEFLDKYRDLEQMHKGEIVIVMLTTSIHPDDNVKANESGQISGFETKPLTAEKLDAILRKYFPINF